MKVIPSRRQIQWTETSQLSQTQKFKLFRGRGRYLSERLSNLSKLSSSQSVFLPDRTSFISTHNTRVHVKGYSAYSVSLTSPNSLAGENVRKFSQNHCFQISSKDAFLIHNRISFSSGRIKNGTMDIDEEE